uniref:Uncharacterized protein n=1 Tax=Arundo donax TaxID=35708 RepID=A0A0A9AUG7_ARUDO
MSSTQRLWKKTHLFVHPSPPSLLLLLLLCFPLVSLLDPCSYPIQGILCFSAEGKEVKKS